MKRDDFNPTVDDFLDDVVRMVDSERMSFPVTIEGHGKKHFAFEDLDGNRIGQSVHNDQEVMTGLKKMARIRDGRQYGAFNLTVEDKPYFVSVLLTHQGKGVDVRVFSIHELGTYEIERKPKIRKSAG